MSAARNRRSRTAASRALAILLVLGAGLFLGVVAALLSGSVGGRGVEAFAGPTPPATCGGNGTGADTVHVTGLGTASNPDMIGIDANGDLELMASGSPTWVVCGTAAATSITFSAANGTTAEYLEFDESGTQTNASSVVVDEPINSTSGNCFTIGGASAIASTGGSGNLIVWDAPGGQLQTSNTSILFGSGCTAQTLPAQLAGVQLIGNGADTLSTAGTPTGGVSTLPTTFTVGDPGTSSPETLVIGSGSNTTLDFAGAGSAEGCSTSSCSLSVNTSGASQTLLPDGTVGVPANSGTANNDQAYLYSAAGTETYDFSTSANSGTSTAPVITNFEFTDSNPNHSSYTLGSPVYFWGADQTYTVPSVPSVTVPAGMSYVRTSSAPADSEFGADGSTGTTLDSSTSSVTASYVGFYTNPGTDTFYVSGSSNRFYPTTGPDYFYDNGTGNTVDFTGVTTSSGAPLEINASGAQEPVDGAQLANGTAAIGANPEFYFLDGPGKTTDNDFTTFNGAKGGDTEFIAGDAAGLTFSGFANTTTNSVVFDTTNGIVANLGSVPETGSRKLASNGSPQAYTNLPADQVLVDNPATGIGYDTLSAVYTLTGPSTGYSTFYSGAGTTAYNITGGAGGNNTFYGATAPVTFTSGGETNDFVAGPGVETFAETTASQNPQNTIDFSSIATGQGVSTTTRLVINVSGANTTVADYGAGLITTPNGGTGGTVSTSEVYSFGTGGSQFNNLIGATTGYTTFDGGSGQYNYVGNGSPSTNILDFSAFPTSSSTTLSLDATQGQATLSGVLETWQNVYDLIGLSTGSTTFKAGSTGGYIFQGEGSNNAADFSSTAEVNLTANPIYDRPGNTGDRIGSNQAYIGAPGSVDCTVASLPGSCDDLADISTIAVGQSGHAAAFTIYAGSANETFSDLGTGDTVTLDFSSVSTDSNSPLTVDVSGGPNSGTATVGNVTYNFTSGTSAFKDLIGPATGNTVFVASPNPGYNYVANGTSGNSIDFSSATSGVLVAFATPPGSVNVPGTCTLGTPTATSGTVCIKNGANAGQDTISDITTVTGSSLGNNIFAAGAGNANTSYSFKGNGNDNTFVGGTGGSETFTSNGTGNTFTAGPSNETFSDTQSGNIVDLSQLTGAATVNVTGGSAVGSVNNDTAASGVYTYTFTSFGSNATVFYGSAGGTTFYAGAAPDTFEGFDNKSNTLSFQFAPGSSLTVTVGTTLSCGGFVSTASASFGAAQLGSVGESFCGIATLDGLPGGSTSFVGAPGASGSVVGSPVGGYTFTGYGQNNSVSFSALSGSVTVNLNANPNSVSFNSFPAVTDDTLVDITTITGGAGTGNYFYAANQQNDTFNVPTGSTKNTVDFTYVQTSSSSLLVINLTGGPVGSQSNGTADISGFVYSFTGTTGAFTTFVGAANGETHFLASAGAANVTYSFQAAANTPGNLVDFSAVPFALSANLATGVVTWNTNVKANLTNITSVIGSSAKDGGDNYTTGSGTYSITTSTGNNFFNLGTGSVAITDPNPGNTINFAGVGSASELTVNVSGSPVGSLNNDEAENNGTTYTFSNEQTIFDSDATAQTYFYVGAVAGDVFNGGGGVSNPVTLDYSQITPNGALTICVVGSFTNSCKAGQIFLGTVKQTFTNVTDFIGLASGSTTFIADNTTTGLTFTGTGGTNTADFSTANSNLPLSIVLNSVTIDLQDETVAGSASNDVTFAETVSGATTDLFDTITGVSVVYGSAYQPNTFVAGQSSEVFKDLGSGHQDTIDLSNVVTSGASLLNINVSSATATGNGFTYTFSTGAADFTAFLGSSEGNTRFVAPKNTGAYTFTGSGSNNTADFSANSIGVVANMGSAAVNDPVVGTLTADTVNVDGEGSPVDNINDVQFLIGSPTAANTFYGGLNGTEFESLSGFNTLSYIGLGSSEPIYFDEPISTVYQLDVANQSPATTLPSDNYSLPGTLVIQGTAGNDVFRVSSGTTQIQGGGGVDTIDLGALDGVTVNMQGGTVSGQAPGGTTIGGVTWNTACPSNNPGCPTATLLTVGAILGSQGSDTYQLASGALLSGAQTLSITAGKKSASTLDLSNISEEAAIVVMPVTTGSGTVTGLTSGAENDTFTGITNLIGTAHGGDTVYAGTGTETLTEDIGSSGTLNLSLLPKPATPVSYTGVTINVTNNAGIYQGTVTSPAQVGLTQANITGFSTFIGTNGNDTFIQTGSSPSGGYMFAGGMGSNTVNLSSGEAGTTLTLSAPTASSKTDNILDNCTAATSNNDGLVVDSNGFTVDQFSCVNNITSTGSTFDVEPGQSATLNGGGSGVLDLVGAPTGEGATINLLTGTVSGPGNDYAFSFSGMSTIDGTAYNDTFIDGPGTFTLNGGGGSDAISFSGAPASAEVNLSDTPYLIPTGYAGAGTDLLAGTATGGYGGTLTLNQISSVVGTANFNDLLIGASSGVGSMIGGSGNERFVLTGGFEYITAGSGSSTLDLSELPGATRLNLAASGPQYLGGASAGGVWILAGNVSEVIASPGGSTLLGGAGTLLLQGGIGNDTLVAGAGTQTLVGGGGTDVLIGGSGTDSLQGGAQAVIFEPGSGNDTLTSQTSGNLLDYVGAPSSVTVNLTSNSDSVPPGQEFAGTTAPAQTASGGWGATVNLAGAGISTVYGNSTNDLFIVGSGDTVYGGAGNDLFIVAGGNNTLYAGTGTKSTFLFIAGGPVNVINGGGKSTVDFSQGTAGVTVNLQSGTASGGFTGSGTNDQLTGILNIVGTPYNDVLIAGASGATIVGNGATGCGANCGDFLEASPSGGDTLEVNSTGFGSGNDTFCADNSCAVSGTSTNGGNVMIGGSGNDNFFADQGAGDTINGEGGFNYALVGPHDTYTGINEITLRPT